MTTYLLRKLDDKHAFSEYIVRMDKKGLLPSGIAYLQTHTVFVPKGGHVKLRQFETLDKGDGIFFKPVLGCCGTDVVGPSPFDVKARIGTCDAVIQPGFAHTWETRTLIRVSPQLQKIEVSKYVVSRQNSYKNEIDADLAISTTIQIMQCVGKEMPWDHEEEPFLMSVDYLYCKDTDRLVLLECNVMDLDSECSCEGKVGTMGLFAYRQVRPFTGSIPVALV